MPDIAQMDCQKNIGTLQQSKIDKMNPSNRRNFLKLSGLSFLPAILPASHLFAVEKMESSFADEPRVDFFGDGKMFDPAEYI